MKVIITGSSGFIGSYLSQKLISLNKEVVAASRTKSLYVNYTIKFYNKLVSFSNNENFPVHLADSNLNIDLEIDKDKKVYIKIFQKFL